MVALPELEHEQRPEGLAQIGAAVEVPREQRAHRLWLEDAALAKRALAEDVLEERAQRAADPGCDGNSESLLGLRRISSGTIPRSAFFRSTLVRVNETFMRQGRRAANSTTLVSR